MLLDVLQHPQLVVQSEEQVLAFVAGYVRRHSLEEGLVRQLYMQVGGMEGQNRVLGGQAVHAGGGMLRRHSGAKLG